MIKRFIAGAICPSCKLIDKIQLKKIDDRQTIECINCGFSQSQTNLENTGKGEA
jgi:uncharacterized metal-binding protein (TIGR02443 family)